MSIVIATMGVLRGKRVVLGVRQDSRAYVRRRHPGRRAFGLAADIMQAAFKALARRCPIAVVGADLAEQFPDARELQPFHVSLVADADVRSEDPPARGRFARRILTVGRLDAEKNPLLLAEAMARLRADGALHPPWRLDVYGEGPLEPELTRKIEELGLQDVVTLRGYVGIDAGLREAYERADAFLHVSWTEGMPQVLIEAFAARLPTVATDVGGVAALADDAALLVPAGDAQAVADATAPTWRRRRAAHQVGRSWNGDRARTHDRSRGGRPCVVPHRWPGVTVDVSVLTPVLNEERHIEDAVATMRSQQFEGELEFIFADGGSSDRTRVDPRGTRPRRTEDPCSRQPGRTNRLGTERRTARSPRKHRRADGCTYAVSSGVPRGRRRTAAPGRRCGVGERLQVPHGVDAGSRAVALALGLRLGDGRGELPASTGEEIEASTGFTGVLDRGFLERVGGWDEGWPVNQDSELGARVAAAGGRMVVVPAGAGSLADALELTDRVSRQRSLVVIVSDFRGRAGLAAGAAAPRRPAHRAGGRGPRSARAGAGRRRASFGSSTRRAAGSSASTRAARSCASGSPSPRGDERRQLVTMLSSAGVRHVALSTEGDWLRPLAAFLRRSEHRR